MAGSHPSDETIDPRHDRPASTDAESRRMPVRIGRYRIERELGRGSFGYVYLAEDETLRRRVALKVPRRDGFASTEQLQLLYAEARHAAALNHPAVVTVHDVCEDDAGTPCIVMEYIEGTSLEQQLRVRRFSPAEAALLLAQVADALAYAHRLGWVHRDLKPTNILIDTTGRPHVVDFGLALHERDQRHHGGEYAGTLLYSAPEQVRREAHRLDGRADIWALGVILYELLVGRRPFESDTAAGLRDDILHRDPRPPRQIDPAIPQPLEDVCLRCLAKPVTERYATAADVARDLRRYAQPAHAYRQTVGGIVALVVLAVCTWLAVVWWRDDPAAGSAGGPAVATPAAPARLPALDGTLDVFVWSPDDEQRRGVGLREPATLPLKAQDQIRVQAQLSRPAYLYLVWIDSQGQVFPVYPWTPGQWTPRPTQEEPTTRIALPTQVDRGWPMEGGPGMETLVLLARESPLPSDTDLSLLLSGFSPQPMKDALALVEFHDGQMITAEQDRQRGPKFFDPLQIDDPVLKNQQALAERLKPHFALIRAVSFANRGGK